MSNIIAQKLTQCTKTQYRRCTVDQGWQCFISQGKIENLEVGPSIKKKHTHICKESNINAYKTAEW